MSIDEDIRVQEKLIGHAIHRGKPEVLYPKSKPFFKVAKARRFASHIRPAREPLFPIVRH